MRGKVKWFNVAKRYGFITREDGGADVFVHLSEVIDGRILQEGEEVDFGVQTDEKGRTKAVGVRPILRRPGVDRPYLGRAARPLGDRGMGSEAESVMADPGVRSDLETLVDLLVDKGVITREELDQKAEERRAVPPPA